MPQGDKDYCDWCGRSDTVEAIRAGLKHARNTKSSNEFHAGFNQGRQLAFELCLCWLGEQQTTTELSEWAKLRGGDWKFSYVEPIVFAEHSENGRIAIADFSSCPPLLREQLTEQFVRFLNR